MEIILLSGKIGTFHLGSLKFPPHFSCACISVCSDFRVRTYLRPAGFPSEAPPSPYARPPRTLLPLPLHKLGPNCHKNTMASLAPPPPPPPPGATGEEKRKPPEAKGGEWARGKKTSWERDEFMSSSYAEKEGAEEGKRGGGVSQGSWEEITRKKVSL